MVVVVPADLGAFEADLSVDSLNEIVASLSGTGLDLYLPKWAARTKVALPDTLAALGSPTAFTGDADFCPMVTDQTNFQLDQVEHEVFIEVDEQGTRAVASTGAEVVSN